MTYDKVASPAKRASCARVDDGRRRVSADDLQLRSRVLRIENLLCEVLLLFLRVARFDANIISNLAKYFCAFCRAATLAQRPLCQSLNKAALLTGYRLAVIRLEPASSVICPLLGSALLLLSEEMRRDASIERLLADLVLGLVARQVLLGEDEVILHVPVKDVEVVFARQHLMLGAGGMQQHAQLSSVTCAAIRALVFVRLLPRPQGPDLNLVVVAQSVSQLLPCLPHVARYAREVERLKVVVWRVLVVKFEIARVFKELFLINGRQLRVRLRLDKSRVRHRETAAF